KAFIVWSVIVVIFRSLVVPPYHFPNSTHGLAEAAGDIILGATIVRRCEDTGGFPKLNELAEIHERRKVGDARGLLHIVGHNRDRVVVLELVNQFLDLGG